MKYILVVEDSRLFYELISKRISQEFPFECIVKTTYAGAVELLEQRPDDILLAILDLTLPDAHDGEVVEYVTKKNIPTIVVTARVNDEIRDRILHLQVFDYIIKGPHTLDLLTTCIRRFLRNSKISILVVDDSALARETTAKLLASQYFTVIEACHGIEALQKLEQHQSIRLVLTDFHMPKMDGFELISAIRARYTMDNLAIIGFSARGNSLLSAQFLKRGANDFLSKPYFPEELVWRVNQNIEMLDHIVIQRSLQSKLKQKVEEQTTKINESQAMILQQEKLAAIGQLAAGVAHEINSPLGFISSNLNALNKYIKRNDIYLDAVDAALKSLPDKARSLLSEVHKKQKIDLVREDLPDLVADCLDGTERMTKIVLGLKGFARKDDGVQKLADINQCLEEAISLSWNELKYKAEVERDFADLPQTYCCPQQICQVFVILLVNAAHAIDKTGKISISTRPIAQNVDIVVRDTGCGIAPENLTKIFEPFFTTKEIGKGTGLGMGIAREIMTRHQGSITVESELGRGTTFALRLPVLQKATLSA